MYNDGDNNNENNITYSRGSKKESVEVIGVNEEEV